MSFAPMRRVLAGLLLSLFLLGPQAQAGGTFHRGNSAEPDTLDPHRSSGIWESAILNDMIVGLLTEAADGSLLPGAATHWDIAPDGLRYTFHMRDGMVWSDGVPVTADDFVFSLRRILDPMTAARYASLLYFIKGAREVNTGQIPPGDLGVSAPDPATLVIDLAYPAPYLLELTTHQTMYPVPPHVVRKHGDNWVKPENIVGNGPFKLAEWKPNASIRLVRNPLFYDAENVALDAVVFYPVNDANVALAQFRAGKLDMNTGFPSQQIPWLKKNMPEQARIFPYMSTSYININVTEEPFGDPRIRRALNLAIDRDILVTRVLRDGSNPTRALVPPNIPNYVDHVPVDFEDMSMDARMEEARALLAEAGYGPDNPLRFEYRYVGSADAKRIAVAMSAMWRRVGVIAHIISSEAKVHYNDLQVGNFKVAWGGWVADYADAQNFLYLLLSSTKGMNYGRYSNPRFDELMAQAGWTIDLQARARLMAQAEALMLSENPIIPYANAVSRMLVAPHVKGYVDNVKNTHPSRFIRLDPR